MIQKDKYKHVLQKHDYDCGVAATLALLINSGIENVVYSEAAKELNVKKTGVRIVNIKRFISKFPELKPKSNLNSSLTDLKNEFKKGRLCMVVYQSWGKEHEIANLECGHYSVAAGISQNKIYLLDPTAYKDWGDGVGWRVMEAEDFKKKWVDKERDKIVKGWMLSVKPLNRRDRPQAKVKT